MGNQYSLPKLSDSCPRLLFECEMKAEEGEDIDWLTTLRLNDHEHDERCQFVSKLFHDSSEDDHESNSLPPPKPKRRRKMKKIHFFAVNDSAFPWIPGRQVGTGCM